MLNVPLELATTVHATATAAPRRGRHGRRVTQFPSRKNNRVMGCDSLLEADFCLLLEQNPKVKTYITQPCTVKLLESNTRYTPDFQVTYHGGEVVFYEVKHDDKFGSLRNKVRRQVYEPLFAQCGYVLETIRQSDIYKAGVNSDLRKIYWYSFGASPAVSVLIAKALSSANDGSQTIAELLGQGFRMEEIAYGLFYRTFVKQDGQPLQLGSRVQLRR